jgi:hypothetical protein
VRVSRDRLAVACCVLAGGGDALTGFLLLTAPAFVLRMLGLPVPDGLAMVRFVGVFVACVGLAYFWGLSRRSRLATAIEITAGFRLAVALFLAVAATVGEMEAPWLLVGGYDAVVATVQLVMLSRGMFADAA